MANYYVSNTRGNDSTGTGSASSPWATINKPIGSSPAITLSGGDTVYIEPSGTPYRESVSLGLTPTSTNTLAIVADNDGAGFLAGGYATPARGRVDWRAWTDDVTPMTGGPCLLAANAPYVTVRGFKFLGANNNPSGGVRVTGASPNWTIEDCLFFDSSGKVNFTYASTSPAGDAWNLTVKRCRFYATNANNVLLTSQLYTTEYNLNALFQNCKFFSKTSGLVLQSTAGTGSNLGMGLTVQNCGFYFTNQAVVVYSSNAVTTTAKVKVYLCKSLFGSGGIQANNTSMVDEQSNAIPSGTPRTNVTSGTGTLTTMAPAIDDGDSVVPGDPIRPFGTPSLTGGFGGFATTAGTVPTVDNLNRPRPAGFSSLNPAVGELERHDTAAKETTTVKSGSVGSRLDGPSGQYLEAAVNAAATTITLWMQYDSNHGATNKPQLIMDACPEIGVSSQTVTMTASAGAWEQVTIGPFTPTAKGVVRLRVYPRPAAANGKVYFGPMGVS